MALSPLYPGSPLRGRQLEAIVDAINALQRSTGAIVTAADPATASTSYVDLATIGPSVTLVTGTSAIVTVTSSMASSGGALQYMSFAVSGASSIAATDLRSLRYAGTTAAMYSATFVVTGLTAGSNTFVAKYRATAGTADFYQRHMVVIPFGS